ncbi:Peptidase family S41 [Lachnospiraceae bacterium JC7]|nr:Peptidase family S41 [Lachnospiraceae bacterium JC7]
MRRHLSITLSLLLVTSLMAGCNTDIPPNATETATSSSPEITKETYPLYFKNINEKSEIELYFYHGGNIPYISMEETLDLLNKSNTGILYELKYDDPDHTVITRKDTSFDADFDFINDTIKFMDFNAFLRLDGCGLLDVFSPNETNAGALFKQKYINERYGKVISFDLASYDIDLIKAGDGRYIPLQTVSDLFLSHYGFYALFNRECVIIAENHLDNELREIYYSAAGTVPEDLAQYSYNELCFALDNFYGLKEIHDIQSFDEYFFEMGLKKKLLGTDSVKADEALAEVINFGFDDLHSNFLSPSYSTDLNAFNEVYLDNGPWRNRFEKSIAVFGSEREKAFPEGVPSYEEVGNTAYITFDSFTFPDDNIDYLSEPREDELYDTIRLIQYSCDRILREDSPVENVVMDLSNNKGGYADAAAYVIAAYLGRGETNTKDMLTGATTTYQYLIDTNRDGKFDINDTLAEKGFNLYCLTSPVSFSCGNLVPNVFKTSPFVTNLGQTSGGGSCSIMSLSTARGNVFNISSNNRLSMFKNGSFYDIDRGADPDIYIAKISDFYDRKTLTDYLNNVY